MCVRLEVDGPVVEEFELSLRLAASHDIWRGTALSRWLITFGSSPRLWWCSVLLCALFACVVRVRVMYNCFFS